MPPIEALGYRYVGVDLRLAGAATVPGHAHALPFAGGSFDVVGSSQVLEHLRDPRRTVREVTRVLKRGGRFCGSTSLLEPFHDSYFNFTHLGLAELLSEEGEVKRNRIEAGSNVALFVVYCFFDMLGVFSIGRRVSAWVARVVFTRPFLLLRLLHRAETLVKAISGLGSSGTSERVLWSRRALSWSGYLLFGGEKF